MDPFRKVDNIKVSRLFQTRLNVWFQQDLLRTTFISCLLHSGKILVIIQRAPLGRFCYLGLKFFCIETLSLFAFELTQFRGKNERPGDDGMLQSV